MVAKGYGVKDSDRVGKEKVDRAALKASTKTMDTGKIGGKSNRPASYLDNASKGASNYPAFRKGGRARR